MATKKTPAKAGKPTKVGTTKKTATKKATAKKATPTKVGSKAKKPTAKAKPKAKPVAKAKAKATAKAKPKTTLAQLSKSLTRRPPNNPAMPEQILNDIEHKNDIHVVFMFRSFALQNSTLKQSNSGLRAA